MSNFHHRLQDWFVMTQYCSRWITARWWWYYANFCAPLLPVHAATPRRLLYKWDRWYLPSSLFKFGNFLVYITFLIPCARSSLSSTILALSQSITWFSFTEWSLRAEPPISLCDCLLYTQCFTDFPCLSLVLLNSHFQFSFHSPIYFLSHSLQSTMVYIPSLGSVLSLGPSRNLFRIECGFMTVTIPLFLNIRANVSEIPRT